MSELSVGDMGTVATSFNRSRYTTLPSSTPQSYKRKVQTLYVYLSPNVCHYLAERRASTFPLDNLTKVSTYSFSKVYFYFREGLVVLKGPRFRASPIRTYVVVGSLAGAVSLVVGASSPSSDLVGTNGTFVDTPPGYRYL